MTQKLATFKIDSDRWQAFIDRANEGGSSASALLKWFVDAYLEGNLDPSQYQAPSSLDNILDERLAPLQQAISDLDERLGKLNRSRRYQI